jgi:hypothetical protein
LAAIGCLHVGLAFADHAPVWVIPHPQGVPIIVNGVDVSGAVIEGDWGLHRPGHGRITIYPGETLLSPPPAGYFPATGRRPHAGRHEVETPQDRRPRRAQRYFRQWSTDGPSRTIEDYPSVSPPAVIEAPQAERRPRRPSRRQR